MRMPLQPISDYQTLLVNIFAEHCISTNKSTYTLRNQGDMSKVLVDIINGKIAEYMVFNTLLLKGKKPTPPDIMIYDKAFKTFDADIKCGDINVHVKSCEAESLFANSWVFQPNDTLVNTKLDTEYLALCVMSDEPYMYLVKASDMDYNRPAKVNLDKRVVYEDYVKTFLYMKSNNIV
jgi:hypothetical protein